MQYLSTEQVASLIKVTETTIKRWSDEGKIPCHKTLGGHRKFLMKEIIRFAEEHSYPLTGAISAPLSKRQSEILEFAVQTKNYSKIAKLFYEEALQGDRDGLYELLSYLCRHHIALATLGDEVIRPAMTRIGEEWRVGKLEVNQEHLASNSVLEALVRLNPDLHRKPINGLSAVCACAEGDHHQIGLRGLAYALEGEGWNVHYLGANTPTDTLKSFMKTMKPELICVSSTVISGKKQFVDRMSLIGEMAHSYRATFLVGGFLLGNYAPSDFNCDYISSSIHDAMAFIRDKFQLRPGPKKIKHRLDAS
jgi:excisionase family DNA binding protein